MSKIERLRRREKSLSAVLGAVWGVVVGGVIVTVASQLSIRHDLLLPRPEAATVATPNSSDFDQARPEGDPDVPSTETMPGADVAAATPGIPALADATPSFDTASAAAPNTGLSGPDIPARPIVPAQAGVDLSMRETLRPEIGVAPEAAAPLPPGTERAPEVARDAPVPPVREQAEDTKVAEPLIVAPVAPNLADQDEAATDVALASGLATRSEQISPQPDAVAEPVPDVATGSAALPDTNAATNLTDAPIAPPAETGEGAGVEVAQLEVPEVEPASAPTAPDEPQGAGDLPQTLQQPVATSNTPATVRVLPSAPNVESEPADTEAAQVGPDQADADTDTQTGALTANRSEFAADRDLAKLAVVLLNDGQNGAGSAIAALPAEVSVAVDAARPGAADIAEGYRNAGREVVLIPAIPTGATAQDVEVALTANLAAIDDAVAVMDPGTGGFQRNREAVGQVVAIIAETGHGLITAPQGLNTAQQIAQRFDVPSALIFNDLGDVIDAAAASRTLDRIAFRARTEAGIIIIGRNDAPTVAGIAEWITSRAAAGLQLAPVSAVLDPVEADDAVPAEGSEPQTESDLPQVRRLPQIQSATVVTE